eukprot:m.94005 g.94005  ORF g.94005 m.94005 type:complete len:473 (-) comp51218_c0_seq2:127-1545(-)
MSVLDSTADSDATVLARCPSTDSHSSLGRDSSLRRSRRRPDCTQPHESLPAILSATFMQKQVVGTTSATYASVPAQTLPSYVNDFTFISQTSTILAACQDYNVYLLDTLTNETRTIPGHTKNVLCVAYSAAEDLIASAGYEGVIYLFAGSTPRGSGSTSLTQPLASPSPAPQQQGLVVPGSVASSTSPSRSLPSTPLSATRPSHGSQRGVSPNSQCSSQIGTPASPVASPHFFSTPHTASASASSPTSSAPFFPTSAPVKLYGHRDWICQLRFDSSLHALLSCSYDCTVRLWNTATRACVGVYSFHTDIVSGVSLSSSLEAPQVLLSHSRDGLIAVWRHAEIPATVTTHRGQPISIKPLRVLSAHAGGVNALQYSPDGLFFVSGGNDMYVRMWSSGTFDPIRAISCNRKVTCLCFHGAEQLIIGYTEGHPDVADAKSGVLVRCLDLLHAQHTHKIIVAILKLPRSSQRISVM